MINIIDIKKGNYLLLNYDNGVKEICQVVDVNVENDTVDIFVLSNGSKLSVPSKCLEGIPFKEDLLDKLDVGFVNDPSYEVYALPENGAFVKYYPTGHDLIIRKETCGWVIVLENPKAPYGCEFKEIPYLHIFQNYAKEWWGLDTDSLFDNSKCKK